MNTVTVSKSNKWITAGIVVLTAHLLLITGCSISQPVKYTPEKIAFCSNRDGNYEIYSVNPDGSKQTRLTNNTALDMKPSVSRDGTKIAFESDRDGTHEIYVMNADGTDQKRLTNNLKSNSWWSRSPVWSPDDKKIAFVSVKRNVEGIAVMNADGSNQTILTNASMENRGDYNPAWSPDGSKILFESFRENDGAIYVMNVDGSGEKRLTSGPELDDNPSWSPDGRWILFDSYLDPYTTGIYIMAADGTNKNKAGSGFDAEWSPDGTRIVFRDYVDGSWDIFSMDIETKNRTRITDSPADDGYPSWGGGIALPSTNNKLTTRLVLIGTSIASVILISFLGIRRWTGRSS